MSPLEGVGQDLVQSAPSERVHEPGGLWGHRAVWPDPGGHPGITRTGSWWTKGRGGSSGPGFRRGWRMPSLAVGGLVCGLWHGVLCGLWHGPGSRCTSALAPSPAEVWMVALQPGLPPSCTCVCSQGRSCPGGVRRKPWWPGWSPTTETNPQGE